MFLSESNSFLFIKNDVEVFFWKSKSSCFIKIWSSLLISLIVVNILYYMVWGFNVILGEEREKWFILVII